MTSLWKLELVTFLQLNDNLKKKLSQGIWSKSIVKQVKTFWKALWTMRRLHEPIFKTWHYFLGSFYLASFQMICRYWVRPYLNVKVAHCSNLSAFENFKNVQEIGLNQWPRNTEPQ